MNGKDENSKKKFGLRHWAILLSLLVHSVVLFQRVKFDVPDFASKQKKPKRMKVVLVPDIKKKRRDKTPKQVVQTEKTDATVEKDTKFLGEKKQNVDRQTVAKKVGIFKKAGKGSNVAVKKPAQAKKKKTKKKGIAKNKTKSQKLKKKKGKISLADLALSPNFKSEIAQKESRPSLSGQKFGDEKLTGFAQSNDFIEDVPLGDMTRLNTIEFKYYGFYHRIRQKLEQHWGNTLREKATKLFKKGRRLPANENMVTSLTITLDHKGNIVGVVVNSTSGVKELDDAAIESFNKAGPFPNPPKGMILKGFAQIEWGFVVKS